MSVSRTGSASPGRGCGVPAVLAVVLSVSTPADAGTRVRRMVVMTGPPEAGGWSGSWWAPSGTADLPPPAEGLGAELASPRRLRADHRPSAHTRAAVFAAPPSGIGSVTRHAATHRTTGRDPARWASLRLDGPRPW